MKTMPRVRSVLALAAVLVLGACANTGPVNNAPAYGAADPSATYSNSDYIQYGVVQSIDLVKVDNAGIGIGAIAGAVVGGLVGNQVGGGTGNTAATVLGAAGGAYAGHALEKRNQPQSDAYKFSIRLSDGSYQSVTQTSNADIRVGDRVMIENGVARRY